MASESGLAVDTGWAEEAADGQDRPKGNVNCLVCRRLGVLPFRRCRFCDLPSTRKCTTIKVGLLLFLLTLLTGLLSSLLGGRAGEMSFLVVGLGALAVMHIVNSLSNEKAHSSLRLIHLHQELTQQHEFLRELSPLETMQECLDQIVRSASKQLRCRRVSIMLADEGSQFLEIVAACGVPQEVLGSTRIPVGQRVSGRVFQGDWPVHVRDAARFPDADLPINSSVFMSGPLLLSRMRWGSDRLGVLSVTEPVGRADFSIDDEFVFSNICQAASVTIHNHKAVAQVRQLNMEFLETLVNAIEARDPYTRGHSERVSRYAEAAGRRLGLDEKALADLRIAGRLHDIGKIGLADTILLKPGRPTEEEWRKIREHVDVAVAMLSRASLVSGALDAIRCHHERLDGSGYTHGLVGAEISLAGRIIGVADSFDAMTSARPYRGAMPVQEAVAELRRCGGTKLDPACVEALVAAVEAGEFDDLLPAQPTEPQPVAVGEGG